MGFSEKQRQILKLPYAGKTALICDGTVRSRKTAVMSLYFLLWAIQGISCSLIRGFVRGFGLVWLAGSNFHRSHGD